MTVDSHAQPRRRDDVDVIQHGDRTLLLLRGQDVAHVLNPTARALWDLCDGETRPDEMAAAVCEVFDVDPHAARRDVATALSRLAEAELLEPGPTAPGAHTPAGEQARKETA